MENLDITMALAILLGSGFLFAKLGNLLHLPSVTGYICAGLILGSSGFNLIDAEMIGDQLGHFTDIALMLIAFGIGEHLELKRLRPTAKNVGLFGVFETLGALLFVFGGTFLVARLCQVGGGQWQIADYLILALLLAAVSVATAPAATLHVMRELRAAGPLTTTLMAVVAIDNGLAIMMFGIAMSAARHLLEAGSGSPLTAVGGSLIEGGGSLALGVATGLLIDLVNARLKKQAEMLTAGLALLLLCGELARYFHFSSLLAGMAASFTIVNRDHRDIRLFRALNAFEPPIYVLFFTLAGLHLNVQTLAVAGWLGLTYFVLRSVGKVAGAYLGGFVAKAPRPVTANLGLALTPQAGVAIGLIFLINNDVQLAGYSSIITPVVLTGVFFSELVGPLCARFAVNRAGEVPESDHVPDHERLDGQSVPLGSGPEGVAMVPWLWERLKRPLSPEGVVLFGANHMATTTAHARLAAILAHYFDASPMAVRIVPPTATNGRADREEDRAMINAAQAEVATMGSELFATVQRSDDIAQGILNAARQNKSWAIVLGYTVNMTASSFQRVIGKVVELAPCSIIVARFRGVMHTERILVPIISMRELYILRDTIKALASVGRHEITILRLLPSYNTEKQEDLAEKRLTRWVEMEDMVGVCTGVAVSTDSRKQTVLDESENHDLVIMAGPRFQGLQRLFFGSLSAQVVQSCPRTVITVFPPAE